MRRVDKHENKIEMTIIMIAEKWWCNDNDENDDITRRKRREVLMMTIIAIFMKTMAIIVTVIRYLPWPKIEIKSL